jgi:CBS domain-containing protein
VITETPELSASDIMSRKIVLASPLDSLGDVAEKMTSADVGSALVVDSGKLVGILTSRDVIAAIAHRAIPSEARVEKWMSRDPVTAGADTPVDEAAELMLARGFHHLPVTDGRGRPIGTVGLRAAASGLSGLPGC